MLTISPLGRICPKLNPTAPPYFLRIELSFSDSKIPSILSGMGITKQLANWLFAVPLLANVLPPGINRRSLINSANFLSHLFLSFFSAFAKNLATRSNIPPGVSTTSPSRSFKRYFSLATNKALYESPISSCTPSARLLASICRFFSRLIIYALAVL